MESSQRTEEAPEGTETTRREGLDRRDNVSRQESFIVESLEKSMGGIGGRGWMAETGNGREARGGSGEGRERASATTFWEPGKW